MDEIHKAKEELRKAYQTDDWDYILVCQVELLIAQAKYEQKGEQYGNT